MNNSVSLLLKSSKDVLPKNNEDIVYFKRISAWDSYGYEPHYTKVNYCWFQTDEEGRFTGNQANYCEGDNEEDGWVLLACVDGGYNLNGFGGIDIYWMTEEDWYNSFPTEESHD